MTMQSSGLLKRLTQGSLVKQILAGLVLGILLALISKPAAEATGLLGTLFVGALKAVAPILVLTLVMEVSRSTHPAEMEIISSPGLDPMVLIPPSKTSKT